MLEELCTHPNVGAAVLVSLGCEGFDREELAELIEASGRPVTTLVIQDLGGTPADDHTRQGLDPGRPRQCAEDVPSPH